MSRPGRARRVLRAIGIALAVPVLLLVLVVGWLHTSSGRATVKARLLARAAERIDGKLEIGTLSYALFGELAVGDVVVEDASGAQVARLRGLSVRPAWGRLLRGAIVIDRVELRGLELAVQQAADGTTNLKKLVKPKPPTPPKPPSAPGEERRIEVRAIVIDDVDVTFDKADGTRIALADFGLDASVDAVPARRDVKVDVPKLGASVRIEKPGVTIEIEKLRTGLAVALERGAGKAKLLPLSAHARLSMKDGPVRETDIAFGPLEVSLDEPSLGVTLDSLLIGALALETLEVRTKYEAGVLSGEQKLQVLGLHLDARRLNELLQKELLASDVDVETTISGPPERVAIAAKVTTTGGSISLDGTVDASDLARPGFDLVLGARDVRTAALLQPGASSASPIELSSLDVTLKGRGKSRDDAEADVTVKVGKTKVGRIAIDEATVDARLERGELTVKKLLVKALGQDVELSGNVRLSDKRVSGHLGVRGDVGDALDRLRKAGVPAKTALPRGAVAFREGDLTVDVEGSLDTTLNATINAPHLALAGGTAKLEAHAELVRGTEAEGKKLSAKTLDARLDLAGVNVADALALRGKKLPKGLAASLSGSVRVTGSAAEPKVKFDTRLDARADSALLSLINSPTVAIALSGEATRRRIDAELTADGRRGAEELRLVSAKVAAPLTAGAGGRPALASNTPLSIELHVPRRSFDELASLVPKPLLLLLDKPIPRGEIEAHVVVGGTAAQPKGTATVDAKAGLLGGDMQRVSLSAAIEPNGAASATRADVRAWLDAREDPAVTLHAEVDATRSPLLPGKRDLQWRAKADVPRRALATLPIPADRLKGASGFIQAHVDLHGTAEDAQGTITIGADDLRRDALGPFGLAARVDVRPDDTAVDVRATLAGAQPPELLVVRGDVGLAGRGLIADVRAKKKPDPALNVAIELPERAVADLARIRPTLLAVPGKIAGTGRVEGHPSAPRARFDLLWDGFRATTGEPARVAVGLRADEELGARVALGPAASPLVTLEAKAPRASLADFRTGKGTLPLAITARASEVDVRKLVPASASGSKSPRFEGTLDWNLDAAIELAKTDAGVRPAAGDVRGALTLTKGRVTIPGSKRVWHDVGVDVRFSPDALRIEKIGASESDVQRKDRTLLVRGEVALAGFAPKSAHVELKTDDWLVFGGDKLGQPDAPRGTLDADLTVDADLSRETREVTATVRNLDLRIPERFSRAHAPEVLSLGDVTFVGGARAGEPTGAVGKLAVPAPPPPPPPAAPSADAPPPRATRIVVRIPGKAHVVNAPLTLDARGEIVALLEGGKRTVRGRIEAVGGSLVVGGTTHTLDHGGIVWDDEHPQGAMDLHFVTRLHPTMAREVAVASAGDVVAVDMVGPISNPKLVFRGAGNAQLYDVLATEIAHGPRVLARPDLPATGTAQVPGHTDLLGLTYMNINLPHNLFLDRLVAWADPLDGPRAYGRLQHMEAERWSKDGKTRVRIESRPPTAGQSEGDVELGWVPTGPSRALFGVGARAGSRLGGGPSVFFEWVSED